MVRSTSRVCEFERVFQLSDTKTLARTRFTRFRMCAMTLLLNGSAGHHHHDDEPHEDYGGLHRDLLATGSQMSRRSALRMAAKVGMGASVLQLLGCSSSSDITGSENNVPGGSCPTRIPTETAGPYPAEAPMDRTSST
jgi:hypothetical protein